MHQTIFSYNLSTIKNLNELRLTKFDKITGALRNSLKNQTKMFKIKTFGKIISRVSKATTTGENIN